MRRGAAQGPSGGAPPPPPPPPGDAVASSPCGHAFVYREREFNKLLLEAAGNGFAAPSERTAAGPSVDPSEEHMMAVRSVDTHPGAPVIVATSVPSVPIADEVAAAAARAGA